MTVHPDPLRAASHASMFAHLAGPFTGGAADNVLELDATGAARVDWPARQPLLLVALRQSAVTGPVRVRVAIAQSSGEVVEPVELEFARLSEPGSSLLAYRPGPASMVLDTVTPFDVTVSFTGGGDPAALRALVELRVVEGNLGRLLYVAGSEKMRLRRAAAELEAGRRLAGAAGEALDRAGADLGVPRLNAHLAWDETFNSPTIEPEREQDDPYRVRLSLYRRFLRPTRVAVGELLNGPGSGPNTGLPSAFGVTARFNIAEPDTELLVAIRLVSSPDGAPRTALLEEVKQTFLVQPGVDVPSIRLLPSFVREEENVLRHRLAANLEFPASANLAPALARVLDRVARCRRALGVPRRWKVLRTQDDAGGSRYELGVGADVEPIPAAELDTMAANLEASALSTDPGDTDTPALLATLRPRPSADDPDGRWLLDACGLKTFHRLAPDRVYLSHLAVHGLVVNSAPVGNRVRLEARWHASGDGGGHVELVLALAEADAARAAAGLPGWTLLSGNDESGAWTQAQPPGAQLLAALTSAHLGVMTTPQAIQGAVAALGQVPNELVATLQLDPALASGLAAADPGSVASLVSIIKLLRDGGVVAVLPLALGDGRVLLVAGATALPGDATTLTARSRTSFRWHLVPLVGQGGSLARKVGSRNEWSAGNGLAAVVVIAPGRRGTPDPRRRIDPLELAVSLPPGALLSLPQYELVMNLLDRAHPLGVVVDTLDIRRRIDADADGDAEPLSRSLSRTFRPYRQRRHLGAAGEDQT
jgi:hypothetical protein